MGDPIDDGYRMPPEWEPHTRCWMAWPCNQETFTDLTVARRAYAAVARAIARFEEVRGLAGSAPVPVREISSTLGRPDVKIVDAAREVRASLIVMGAYGRNRITDYFLGSNSAAVVRTSPVAVLLAR